MAVRGLIRAGAFVAEGGPPLVRRIGLLLFPVLFGAFGVLYFVARPRYDALLREDRLVEWTTFAAFVVAALLAALRARRARVRPGDAPRFFTLFCGLCVLAALEEISWGQRVLGIPSPEFFVTHSDQQEINVHNVLQQWSGLTTKLVAGIALCIYGVGLPLVAWASRRVRTELVRIGLVLPPRFLIGGFALATLLMFDLPTYREEELGELFYALAFVLFMASERWEARPRRVTAPAGARPAWFVPRRRGAARGRE